MSNYGSKDLKIELADAGAVLRDISQLVRAVNGASIEALVQDSHAFGDSWGEVLYTGFAKMGAVVLDGLYDDGANTPDALWSRGATRQLKFTWGSTKTTSFNVVMTKYDRSPEIEKAHKYQMTLTPTGAVTET